MSPGNRSLMDFIDTPVVVGDPDGRAVYVNPAFETDFLLASEDVVGKPLANLFEGGGREMLLHAVASICDPKGKNTTRFALMAQDRGYKALASAVEAEAGRVGVILLLIRESPHEARLQAFRREVMTTLDEISEAFEAVASDAHGGDAQRSAVEDGVRCVDRIRKWGAEVAASLKEG
jgi:nitrogen-specific signal transduction histidine kinase